MNAKRLFALLLTALMLVGMLAACGGDDTTTTTTTTTTKLPGGTPTLPADPIEGSLGMALEQAGYKIVAPTNPSAVETAAAGLIERAINAASGEEIDVTDDYVKRGKPIPANAKEILVGITNRASSKATAETLAANRANSNRDWQIIMKNDEVLVLAATNEGLTLAAEAFAAMILQPAESYPIGSYDSGIQKYAWTIDKLGGVAVESHTIVIAESASEAIQTAAADLQKAIYEASGFTLEIVTDTTAQGANELVLGETSRAVSTAAIEKLKANRLNNAYDGVVHADSGKLAISGGSENAVVETAAAFVNAYLTADKQGELATISTVLEKGEVQEMEIGGTDASYFTIVYADGADFDTRYVAMKLQQFLYDVCGYDIKIVTDATASKGKEILIGKTSRPASTALELNKYAAKVDANGNLVIDAGHYVGIQHAYNALLTAWEAQADADKLTVAPNYNATGTVTDVALTWEKDGSAEELLKWAPVKDTYTLVWNDEFEGVWDAEEERTRIDYEKWSGNANMSMPKTTLSFDEDAVRIVDGKLVMITDVVDPVARTYTSNYSVTTHDTMNFTGGFLEMRAQVPFKGLGEWPSYWSTSGSCVLFKKAYQEAHNGELYDAGYGVEVDFFEIFSSRDTVVPNLHKWFTADVRAEYGAPNRVQLSGIDAGAGLSGTRTYKFAGAGGKTANENANDWHNYGFLWTPTMMSFSVDDLFYYSYSLKDEDNNGKPFNPTYTSTKTGEKRTFTMDGYTYDTLALAIILNDMFFPEAYCESEGGAWAASNVVNAKNDSKLFPLIYTVERMRLYQTEGDRLYTPDIFGGTKMATGSRFQYVPPVEEEAA